MTASRALAGPGSLLWVARYKGPANTMNKATALAVSPTGKTVYVTGSSGSGYATVAYNAVTGAQVWATRYGSGAAGPASIVVSPKGGTVFVTGSSNTGTATGSDYLTVAYNAATGAVRWAAYYDGPTHLNDYARSIAVSRDASMVFVTGASDLGDGVNGFQFATVAYDAATGAQLWVALNGSGGGASSVAVSPKDGTVYVTGEWFDVHDPVQKYDTFAYDPATGALLWGTAYASRYPYGRDTPSSMAVGPFGTVYVTGTEFHVKDKYLTICINSAGTVVWGSYYRGPTNGPDTATSVAVSQNGSTVYVTGSSQGHSGPDYATVAYNTHTGARLWARRYYGPGKGTDAATSVAVSRDGTELYVTGQSLGSNGNYDYATVAYDATTGAQLWVKRYNGPANGDDIATSVAVSPTARELFVTGSSYQTSSSTDYTTVAYQG